MKLTATNLLKNIFLLFLMELFLMGCATSMSTNMKPGRVDELQGIWKLLEYNNKWTIEVKGTSAVMTENQKHREWIGKLALKNIRKQGNKWTADRAIRNLRSGKFLHWDKVILEIDGNILIERYKSGKWGPFSYKRASSGVKDTKVSYYEKPKDHKIFNENLKDANIYRKSELEFSASLPPILSIEDIVFSEKVLDANEDATLLMTLKNTGPGDAQDVYIELSGGLEDLIFPEKTNVPTIAKNGGKQTVHIPIKGKIDLPTSKATIDINVIDPHFKVNIKGKRLNFTTRKFRNPEFVIAKFAVLENRSAILNNQIDINEIVDVKFAIQNVGIGDAEEVKVIAENNQKGVMLLGVDYGKGLKQDHPKFSKIASGKYKTVTYRYFINSEFKDKNLQFALKVSEKTGRFGLSENKIVSINTELKEEGYIRQVKVDNDVVEGAITIEEIPDFEVDIEKDLPVTRMKNTDTIAVVIGNRDYRKTKNVAYAINDAQTVKRYLIEVLGFKDGNIFFIKNASKSDFELYFGLKDNHKGKLYNAVKAGKSDVFVYYSGHGAPGLKDHKGYFVPVEADPQYIELGGYSADVFYKNLSEIPAKSISVVIDACFSGANIFENISPIVLKVDNPVITLKNGVVISSSTGNQVSSWYNEKKHGMFTYFFLKAIHNKNADFNKDGKLTFDEIYKYISDNSEGVPYYARRIHGVEQTPTIEGQYKDKIFVRY